MLPGSGSAGTQWIAGDEPLYYIVSPKYVIIAKPRNADDHIAWLLQHNQHDKALAAIEAGQAPIELLDEVGLLHLDRLISTGKYAQAAALCPKLLHGSATAWERYLSFYSIIYVWYVIMLRFLKTTEVSFVADGCLSLLGIGSYQF